MNNCDYMPPVVDCDTTDCSYNEEQKCHALAITVGGPEPACDTFSLIDQKGGVKGVMGRVGACKVDNCRFNDKLECHAGEGIHVRRHQSGPDCETFQL